MMDFAHHLLPATGVGAKFKGDAQAIRGRSVTGHLIDRSQRFLSVATVDMHNNDTGRSLCDD